jgi:hypothetical protein
MTVEYVEVSSPSTALRKLEGSNGNRTNSQETSKSRSAVSRSCQHALLACETHEPWRSWLSLLWQVLFFGKRSILGQASRWRSPILQTHLIAESPLPSSLFLPATFFASARLELDAFCIHKAILHPNRSLPFQIGTPEDLMIRSTPV